MSNRPITIATYDDAVEAALARNLLVNQGIEADIVDENVVALDWRLSGALGGIKLQVSPLHAERARRILEAIRFEDDADDSSVRTAIATPEDAALLRAEASAEEQDRRPVNQMADRLFRCAVFGLLFCPLQFYSLYLIACIFNEEDTVSADRRWKVWLSLLLAGGTVGAGIMIFLP